MEKSAKVTEGSPKVIAFLRVAGMFWLIVGIITALLDFKFYGWTPIYSFLLSFSSFIGVICNVLFQIKGILQAK